MADETTAKDNQGAYPPDRSTDIGKLRYSIGDTAANDIADGTASYGWLSDEELQDCLELGGNGFDMRAVAHAFLFLSGRAAAMAHTATSQDLNVAYQNRATEWANLSKLYFTQADEADAKTDAEDGITVVNLSQLDSDPNQPNTFPRTSIFGAEAAPWYLYGGRG